MQKANVTIKGIASLLLCKFVQKDKDSKKDEQYDPNKDANNCNYFDPQKRFRKSAFL